MSLKMSLEKMSEMLNRRQPRRRRRRISFVFLAPAPAFSGATYEKIYRSEKEFQRFKIWENFLKSFSAKERERERESFKFDKFLLIFQSCFSSGRRRETIGIMTTQNFQQSPFFVQFIWTVWSKENPGATLDGFGVCCDREVSDRWW